MKKTLSILLILFLSMIIIPTVKAEGNYYEIKAYNKRLESDWNANDAAAVQILLDNGTLHSGQGETSDQIYLYHGDTIVQIFTIYLDGHGGTYSVGPNLTVYDNFEYTFSEEEKELLNTSNTEFQTLYKYDGIKFTVVEGCKDNEICIASIIEEEIEGIVYANEPKIVGMSFAFDVSMRRVNDYIKYKIRIDNNTEEEYKLNVNNFNKSDYIKYEYSFDDDSTTINAKSQKIIYITIKYDKEIPAALVSSGFEEENTLILTTHEEGGVINPKTGQINLVIILSIAVIVLIVAYVLFDKKTKQITLSILLLAVLIPIGVKALSELTITVNTKVQVADGSVIKSRKSFMNDDEDGSFWYYSADIKTIVFQNKIVEPSEFDYKFDVSEDRNGSVMAYLVSNAGNGTQLYIMCEGKIYANPDSSVFFAGIPITGIIGLEYFDTSKAEDMSGMFMGCIFLDSLNLNTFNTSNVTNMAAMFAGCENLEYLAQEFNTSKVTNMSEMFNKTSLTSLDLRSFNTSKVTDMSQMFQNNTFLKTLLVDGFDTSNLENMNEMFENCITLNSLNLSSFDTSKVKYAQRAFYGCHNLIHVVASNKWDMSNVVDATDMFKECFGIEGSNGTRYDANIIDGDYSRIDVPSIPGYLWDVNEPIIL